MIIPYYNKIKDLIRKSLPFEINNYKKNLNIYL